MGYTVTVQINSKKLREKALAFMKKEYKEYGNLIHDDKLYSNARGPLSAEELSYDHKKSRIGWDYSCLNDQERHYIWCLLRWMAITFNCKKNFKYKNGKTYEYREYPFYVYDGCQSSEILVGDDWINRPEELKEEPKIETDGWSQWIFMRKRPRGLPNHPLSFFKSFIKNCWYGPSPKKSKKIIREELNRLTIAWNQFNEN